MLFVLAGCKLGQKDDEGQVQVSVSILPQKSWIENIAGNDFKVQVMVPPGANPATYEPSPKQIKNLGTSRAYFSIGHIAFEKRWMPAFKKNHARLNIVESPEEIDLIEENGSFDPHTWMSPKAVKLHVKNIYQELARLNPGQKPVYLSNYQEFIHTIDSLDKALEAKFEKAPRKNFLIFHPALSYFARDYGLTQLSIEHEGKEPSVKHVKDVIDQATSKGIETVFVQKQFASHDAHAVSEEIGAEIVQVNPLAEDWLTEFNKTANKILSSLQEKEATRE